MKILAIIPARGGSKRLPGKNIRLLGGKPLILWSIDVVKNIIEICDILVSTDDPAIAAVCAETNALVPWLRPAELSTDTTSSVDVALHALDWYEETYGLVDGLMLLQPTSPFRRASTISQAIDLFSNNKRRPVVGVSTASSHPYWCYSIKGNTLFPFIGGESLQSTRSQDLPPAVVLNGAMYLADPKYLRNTRSFVGDEACPLFISDPNESLDIDTVQDFMLAECIEAAMGSDI